MNTKQLKIILEICDNEHVFDDKNQELYWSLEPEYLEEVQGKYILTQKAIQFIETICSNPITLEGNCAAAYAIPMSPGTDDYEDTWEVFYTGYTNKLKAVKYLRENNWQFKEKTLNDSLKLMESEFLINEFLREKQVENLVKELEENGIKYKIRKEVNYY